MSPFWRRQPPPAVRESPDLTLTITPADPALSALATERLRLDRRLTCRSSPTGVARAGRWRPAVGWGGGPGGKRGHPGCRARVGGRFAFRAAAGLVLGGLWREGGGRGQVVPPPAGRAWRGVWGRSPRSPATGRCGAAGAAPA